MGLFQLFVLYLALAVNLVASTSTNVTIEHLQQQALDALKTTETTRRESSSNCTLANAHVRRDWEYLSESERREYISAVHCLWQLPKEDGNFSAGLNHFDDFVAIHLNLTDYIHETGNFLTWHRYFIWIWEDQLRNRCGYTGYLPYWNWFKYQDDLSKSPVFDGSDTSMGGDGVYFVHNGSIAGNGQVWLPSGNGGGCVKSGPFVNAMLHLGPIRPAMRGLEPIVSTQLDYNERCLRRDLTVAASATFTLSNLWNITIGDASHSVESFQEELQGPLGTLHMHGAGHYSMGGDGSDVFSSLNDPAFYLHHAMLDRVYWIWQASHPEQARTVAGTLTFRNVIPSRNATIDDPLDVGVLDTHRPITDVLDTLGGTPLCYIYL